MIELSGTVVDDSTIEFQGKTADDTDSDIYIRLTFADGLAGLSGMITPPPSWRRSLQVALIKPLVRGRRAGNTFLTMRP